MLNSSHGACGAAAGAWLGVVTGAPPMLALAGTALGTVAAFTPDADHLDAKPVRWFTIHRFRFKGVRFRLKGVKLLGWWLIRPRTWTLIRPRIWRVGPGPLVSWVLRAVSQATTGRKHRGWTHGFFFAFLLASGTFFLAMLTVSASASAYLAAAVWLGVVAALVGDWITKGSLKHAFWPLDIQIELPMWMRIEVGGFAEWVIRNLVAWPALLLGSWLTLSSGLT